MSFLQYKSRVEIGDIVVIYLNLKNIYTLRVEEGKVLQTKFGALGHSDLIGKEYGKKFYCKKGWVYVLHITPELWTQTLPHRTQILYATDISLVTTLLYLRPGSVVVEAGTGSGSLSHSILRTIAPNGHLYTYDFHQERANKALEEFKAHGVDHLVTVETRDVCENGFSVVNVADAVFLDLPHPWKAIESASKAMKTSGSRICCFSPCVELVQKTCSALQANAFVDLVTLECVLRPFEVKRMPLTLLGLGELPQDKEPSDVPEATVSEQAAEEEEDSPMEIQADLSTDGKSKRKEYEVATPIIHITGHTGYLTFATKPY